MNLPADFISYTERLLESNWTDFLLSLEKEPPVSIRINPSKSGVETGLEKVLWSEQGYYLPARPQYTFDPLFHAGAYYPQEASSMIIEQVVKQYISGDVRVLDLCAAPGGKSTHLLSLLSSDSLLVSNEVIRSRANILAENITKWGYPNSIVTNNDPQVFGRMNDFFDLLLVDAPCSGEGMFRKDRKAREEWSPANIALCKSRQQRILADAWNSLKPGGILIYSTCTYNTEENEDNVNWICNTLGGESLKPDIPDEWNITGALKGNHYAYRFFPYKTKGEGFFMSVIKKTHKDSNHTTHNRKEKDKSHKSAKLPDNVRNLIKRPEEYMFSDRNNIWHAFPKNIFDELTYLASMLRIVSHGICIGEMKGKDFVPAHSLAMANVINKDSLICADIDWQQAISYLRKDAVSLNGDLPKGYLLVAYQDIPLGFVKNIGNRSNNLYPQEWRIRTGDIPLSFTSFITKG